MTQRRIVFPEPQHADDYVGFYASGTQVAGEFRRTECGCGIIFPGALPDCPICRGEAWEASAWHPFSRRGSHR